LTDDVIAILVGQFARCPSPMSKLILEHFHGASLRPKPSDTALPHRDAGYSVLIIAQWRDPEDNERNTAWAKETFARLEPFTCRGVYSNYMADDESQARVKLAYGENFPACRGSRIATIPTISSAAIKIFRLRHDTAGGAFDQTSCRTLHQHMRQCSDAPHSRMLNLSAPTMFRSMVSLLCRGDIRNDKIQQPAHRASACLGGEPL
jgi:hypothetical protein